MKGLLVVEYSEIWERGCFNELAGLVLGLRVGV
jgi:hypothetical protein